MIWIICIILLISSLVLVIILGNNHIEKLLFSPSNLVIDIKDVKGEWIYIPVKVTHRKNAIVVSHLFHSNINNNRVFIFSYGSGSNFTHHEETIKMLLNYGDVLAYDYPGYGRSHGYTSEMGVYNSGLAVYDTMRLEYKYADIICYGYCLGGAVSVYISANRNVDGLILQSTFSQISDCIPFIGHILIGKYFRSINHISKVKCPVVQFRGIGDIVVPKWSQMRLHNAIKSPKELVYISGSHTLYKIQCGIMEDALQFIDENSPI
jgi:surfactin synthase thioesterase subunit